jgi:hypothetical protein
MDSIHSHSRCVGFGDFVKKNQTLTFSYQQPTDIPEAEYFGGIQLFPKT